VKECDIRIASLTVSWGLVVELQEAQVAVEKSRGKKPSAHKHGQHLCSNTIS